MSFILCPLCGKMTSRRYFDPASLDLDIYQQDVQGLGKGRGFKSKGRRSILGSSEIISKIKGRLLDLIELLYQEGLVPQEEIAGRLDFPSVDEADSKRGTIADRDGTITRLEDEVSSMEADKEETVESLNRLVTEIQDTLGYELDGEDGDIISRLKSGVEILIDEYLASKAQEEG